MGLVWSVPVSSKTNDRARTSVGGKHTIGGAKTVLGEGFYGVLFRSPELSIPFSIVAQNLVCPSTRSGMSHLCDSAAAGSAVRRDNAAATRFANRPTPYQSHERGNTGNAIFGTQKWTFGAPSWSHLDNIFDPPFSKDLLRRGVIKFARKVIYCLEEGLFGS